MVGAMMGWFWRWLGYEQHWHDYEMSFVVGLEFKLICRCGDVAANMPEALSKMRRPVWRKVN